MVPNAEKKLKDMLDKSPGMRREFEETFKLKNDPRITWIGKFLRISSLDELPQFINVLKGEMSVVGPRPLVKDELPRYGEEIDYVLSVKPGVTGLWQVSGRNNISYAERVKLDVSYVKKRNIALDIKLVLKTVGVMVLPKNNGAY
jgi:lipopolysaccharide/colanic/teichoic acid biosynthesis glycosyltransferase